MKHQEFVFRVLRRLRLLKHLDLTLKSRWGAVPVKVPVHSTRFGESILLWRPSWKSDFFRWLLSAGWSAGQVVDIGANEGQTIAELVSVFDRDIEIIAFEPNAGVADYLERLVSINDLRGIAVFPIALSDKPGMVQLDLTSEGDSGGSIVSGLRPGRVHGYTRRVPCLTFDDLVSSKQVALKQHFLMKIDVEGAELQVLNGARSALKEFRPVIMCEVLWAHTADRIEFMKGRNDELAELLDALGYAILAIGLDKRQQHVTAMQRIFAFPSGIFSADNVHQCDYAFLPRELVPRFLSAFPARGQA